VTNRELAQQLVRRADDHMRDRRALLVAAVAVGETKTIPAAIRVLREWNGPAAVISEAVRVLEEQQEVTE
jgi:hypothetical protein